MMVFVMMAHNVGYFSACKSTVSGMQLGCKVIFCPKDIAATHFFLIFALKTILS